MPPMRARLAVAALILGAPGLLLAPVWRLGGLGAREDDLLYYYPSRVLLAGLAAQGQPPWLNPYNGLDRPLLADPQSAVFYPATWLVAFLPPLWAYGASVWLHYSLAMWGMLRLLRARGDPYAAALFGALAFALCGFMLAHRAHLTIVQAAAWTPLVFWRLDRYVQAGGVRRLAAAALVAALQCYAGHVQIAALTALGSLVYVLASEAPRASAARRWLGVWLLAGGLFAAQAVPTAMYLRHCTRGDRGLLGFIENTWNPISAVNWVLPMLLGQRTPNFFEQPYWGPSHQVEQFAYPGIATLLLAGLVLVQGWRITTERRRWTAVLLLALAIAVSALSPLLYLLPGAALFRVPARALLLFNLALTALAAEAVAMLRFRFTPDGARLTDAALRLTRRPLRRAAVIVIAAAAPFAAAWPLVGDDLQRSIALALRPWSPALLVPLVTIALTLLCLRWIARDWRRPTRVAWLIPLLALDLGVIGWTIDVPADASSAADLLRSERRDAWLRHVKAEDGRLWVVTHRPSLRELPGEYVDSIARGVANTNLLDGVASLTDYGPLQPRMFVERFAFEPWGQAREPARVLADEALLNQANVRWVLLCHDDLSAPAGARLVARRPGALRLYRRPAAAGECFIGGQPAPGAPHARSHALHARSHDLSVRSRAPHHFTIDATFDGPSDTPEDVEIVCSRLALPGWRATVNGQPQEPQAHDGWLLSVRVAAAGNVRVEWRYFPPGLWLGVTISAATAVLLGAGGVIVTLRDPSRRSGRVEL